MDAVELDTYLADCRQLTLQEIRELIPKDGRYRSVLYDLMLDYPLREAKALRPALCIATCRALGGSLESVLRSAAILELYHNAFLIHDDVEDGSEHRRDRPTLHRTHGMPTAVNVGDAMLALALQPLLDNMRLLGVGKALRILQAVARMARESAEGQAIELHWIRTHQWQLSDTDYIRMVYKKTSWYTFITPMLVGGIVVGAAAEQLTTLRKLAALLGVAFQIQDDVLNLCGEGGMYGKEIAGDLWEGKRTLILLHAMRVATPAARARAREILGKRRPSTMPTPANGAPTTSTSHAVDRHFATVLDTLHEQREVSARAVHILAEELSRYGSPPPAAFKTGEDIQFLLALIDRHQSIAYARSVAQHYARAAMKILATAHWMAPSVHRDFIASLVRFVVTRDH